MKHVLLIFLLLFAACAMKPPTQEMANARSAIKTASELPGSGPKADAYLKSAEKALEEAAEAIRQEHFDRAHMKALEAKREAQRAAFLKQSRH